MKTTPASPENYHHCSGHLKNRARELRRRMTKSEKILWQMLRKRSIYGCLFTRQRPVLDYVADFMCMEQLLIIESDGCIHETEEQMKKDKRRDKELTDAGFTVMRFKDWEIIASPNEVYADIKKWIGLRMGFEIETVSQPPVPLQRGRNDI
jgi:very-short-patch-repair endonuclease